MVEEYLSKYQVGKKANRTANETRRLLLVNCAAWKERPIADITRRDVHALLDGIMTAGKGYSANRTYAALKRLSAGAPAETWSRAIRCRVCSGRLVGLFGKRLLRHPLVLGTRLATPPGQGFVEEGGDRLLGHLAQDLGP